MKRLRWISGIGAFALICAGGWATLSQWTANGPSVQGAPAHPLPVVHHASQPKSVTRVSSLQTRQSGCARGHMCSQPAASLRAGTVSEKKLAAVDVFGGSITYGWVDPTHDSFVQRAVATVAASTGVQYRYHNEAIPGFTAKYYEQRFPGRFGQLIKSDHARVVVLAWGLENDMNSRRTLDTPQAFAAALHREIVQTLAIHAVALVVTPPVTKQLVTVDHSRVYQYIAAEHQVVNTFHSPNVVWVNVYKQMNQFLIAHHQSYKLYEGNAWHPNRAGHILAGRILAQDLTHRFGRRPM
ncbi:SGNH/GDSL hydrolase family protein [Alicyclobacillus sp. ALC3]|uniref:SGNH/GDSL hydrolase family protein n=1 Tax=Alicyclobacillus sp. ALC3 TaxID=2796143 RepID=UPI0023795FE3|nr:SGNH/GDSL hydrolase family protein [Alicyclobacillus sp. ALC3]WDL97510.1 SGNH/GDSL hydrolase family protein [Alicyclobacillus sp. ALC3]